MLKAKISLCVFFILSASAENTRKVFKHLRRMRGKYSSTYGQCAESSEAYKETMANQGYLRYTKLSPNARKVFKRIWRMHGKNLCVHGEDAKRLLAYSHNTPRDIKVRISQLIKIRIKNFFRFFLSTLDGMD
jgi:endo-1,4-beta-D-glucanase Y